MVFISAPHLLRVPDSQSRHTVVCRARSHRPPRDTQPGDTQPGDPNPPPGPPDRQQHPRSDQPKSVTSNIWNTPIDDHTPPDPLIRQSRRTSSTGSTNVESRARMAVRPTNGPKPDQTPSTEATKMPRKKRGRPKGSKSVNRASMPQPQISPFMLAVREDIRRRSIAANRDIMSGLFDQSDNPTSSDDVQISAPNGLPDGDANKDLLQELLPILAQQENEERRVVTEEEERMRNLVSTCYTQFGSVHRFSDKLDNLKPYKLQQPKQECETCAGTGMTVCEYCKGEGYVDLGDDGEKFNPKFGNNVFTMPKRVTGNIYHCPLCGGLQHERCVSCFGTGAIKDTSEPVRGASSQEKEERAWKVFDMNELIEKEGDRIEIGLDGTIIMRAKKRGRPRKSKVKPDKPTSPKRRGRPRRSVAKGDTTASNGGDDGADPATVAKHDADLTPDLQGLTGETSAPLSMDGVVVNPGRPFGRTTDFVNTTDYQVGRRLQRQSPNTGQEFQDPLSDQSGAEE